MEPQPDMRRAGTTRWLIGALIFFMAAQTATILLLTYEEAEPYQLDHIGFNAPFALAAVACWRKSRSRPIEAVAWRMLAGAMTFFLIGNLYSVYLVDDFDPSWADASWLTFYVATYVSIALFTRVRLARFSAITSLDGAIGGVGAGAIVSTFVFSHYPGAANEGWVANVTSLSYPAADVTLIVLLVMASHAVGGRERLWWLLGVGFVIFFVGDVTLLYQLSNDTWAPGTPLDLVWPAAVTLIGIAACVPQPRRSQTISPINHFVPIAFAASAIAILVVGQRVTLPTISVALAVLAVVLSAIRMIATVREVRSLANSRAEARLDYLTKLPNRRALSEGLEEAMDGAAQPTALLVLDLDRFKEVNDSLGHVAGDRLLRKVGARLAEAVPKGAVLARLGGDEFAVVIAPCDSAGASRIAGTLLEALKAPFNLAGLRVPVQASVGVAVAPDHARTSIDLLSAADIAMYQAKRVGTGVAVFRVETGDPSRDRLRLITDVPDALARGQFLLHFQAQWSTDDRRVTGLEALVRWRHPTHGLIAPDRFLPLMSQLGMMADLTDLVMRQAVNAWKMLRFLGHEIRMSVNVSASDLTGGRLVETVRRLVEDASIPSGALAVEVTEDAVIVDHDRSVETLSALRRLGVAISIDDYGTGQASLAYLRDLPLDELKIDRSFLRGVPDDTHNSAIVRSTIELAHTLRLPVVAEGVETSDVLKWLSDLGCDICQGYHVARPLPFDELIRWLAGSDRSTTAV